MQSSTLKLREMNNTGGKHPQWGRWLCAEIVTCGVICWFVQRMDRRRRRQRSNQSKLINQ